MYQIGLTEVRGISCEPKVLGGKPCIRGTRIPVSLVLRYLLVGDDPIEDLRITKAQVQDCLDFAALICNQEVTGIDPDA